MVKIYDFGDIADDFQDTLLLGNGASMALAPCFSYRSLFQHATDEGWITDEVQAVFDYTESSDFELVMRMMRHAYHVNRALKITDDATQRAYNALKEALIRAVRSSHIEQDVLLPHVVPIYTFMKRYDIVLSLNYDLTTYWAMLKENEDLGGAWFKDAWINGEFDGDWERLQEPLRSVGGATLVFYPHGNLMLATSLSGEETKLSAEQPFGRLLDRVIRAWETQDRLPLFVSEGETQQKHAAISRSGYLSTVYNDVMTKIGPSVTIYGWSMAENDDHILRRVCSPKISRIAVSVHRDGRTDAQLNVACLGLLHRIRQVNTVIQVRFFDSQSSGCWLAP
jgi:hypothetical protein